MTDLLFNPWVGAVVFFASGLALSRWLDLITADTLAGRRQQPWWRFWRR